MNKISTLFVFAFTLLLGSIAWAQTSTSFNSAQEVADLKAACWQFNGFAYSSTDLDGETGSVTAPISDLPSITTGVLSKPSGDLTITFTYRVISTKVGVNVIKADLWASGIAYTNNVDKQKTPVAAT
jgi:hypothetical protein